RSSTLGARAPRSRSVALAHGSPAVAASRPFYWPARRFVGWRSVSWSRRSSRAAVGTFGRALAGIPFAGLLCALMFMLCIAQLGPGFVLVPAVIWLFAAGDTGWAIFLTVISLVAMIADNFIRPVLIGRGVHLPLLLILAGVIGGLIAYGLIGNLS